MNTARPNRWIFVPGAVALIAFAAYAIVWNQGARAMRQAVTAWTDDVRKTGGVASFDNFRAKGFPFLLRGVVKAVKIGDSEGAWRWSAPTLYIDASPFAIDRLIFSVRDPHILDLKESGRWRIEAPDGRASIAKDRAGGWLLDIQSGPGRLSRENGAESIAAASFLLSAAPDSPALKRLFIGIEAKEVAIARGGVARLETAELAVAIDGLAEARSLRGWRDAGGRIEVQRLHLETSGGKVDVAGMAALDAQGYPSGTLNAEITNPAPIAEALSALGVLSAQDAAKAAAGLTLAAIAGGGKIAAPLVLRDRAAYVSAVRVAGLPQVLKGER